MSEELIGQRIQIKRSNTAPSDMRGLFDGEFGYVKNTNKLYIGQGVGIQPVQVNVTDNATNTTAGLMSAADKAKLDGIATGATANTGDITGVTAGKGLTGGGSSGSVTLNVGAGTGISVADNAVSLATSGVTAGTYGPSAAVTGSEGAIINVPEITVDTYGRVTGVTNRTYTSKNTTYSNFVKSGSGAKAGLVPAPSSTAGTTKYLREDGTWAVPPDNNTTSFTISATATDDDVVVLTGTNGTNGVTFNAKHAKKGPSSTYTSGNTTTSISGSGASATVKIPQITVDTYGHVTAAADENVTITMPTLPTTLKNPNSLTVGSKTYDGSAAVEIVAADLGLSNAMHFRGTVSSKPANTTGYVDGDVILVGNKEYVCSNSAWIELGDESSFKVKQSAVNSPSASGTTTSFIDTITQNANGVISATKKTIPDATTSVKGIAKLHLAANCSTYTSDDGGATPAAVKKAVELFSLVHGGTADGNITIANSETLQSKQPILQWTTVGENTPRMGFAQDQSDGTFIICSLKGTDSYQNGLAIGGGSGNLLWKGVKVATVDQIPTDTGATTVTVTGSGNAITGASYDASTRTITLTKGATYNNYIYTLPTATSSTLGGVKIGDNITVSSGTISLTKANVTTALGYTPPTTNTTYSTVSASAAGLAPAYGTAAAGTIDSSSTDWVLTYNNGSIGWYKLPANAFKNDNTVYTHPTGNAASKTSGLYKFSTDATSHISAVTAVTKADITALGIPAQDTTYSVMTGATANTAGTSGLVPVPAAGNQNKYLRGDGTWVTPTDTKVTQSASTTSSYRHLLLHVSTGTDPESTSGQAYYASKIYAKPSNGTLYATTFSGALSGNASTATKLATARTISLTGSVTGSGSFDGSGDLSIETTTNHTHDDKYVNISGDTMTGNLFIKGSNPYLGFKNSSGTIGGYVQFIESNNTCAIGNGVAKSLVITNTGSITIPASQTFTPVTTNTGSVGTSNAKWNAMYATTFIGSLDGNATSATTASKLKGSTKLTSETIDGFLEEGQVKWATADATAVGNNDGIIMSFGWSSTYGAQIWLDDGSGEGGMKIRNRTASAWNPWRQVLTEYNYNDYAPTLTGTGATGTWGINISGNAATATALGTNNGSATVPVYFSGGKPVACTSISLNAATATLADSSKAIRITTTNPTSATNYYPVWSSGITANTNYGLKGNNGFKYYTLEGTASADGYGYLVLGNAVASGTAGNKFGGVRLYGTAANYVNLRTNLTGTTNRTLYLRDHGSTAYLVSTSSTSSFGSTMVPVYVNSKGLISTCTMATSGNWFGALTTINTDGVMEVGKYIDFHLTDTTTSDYDFRFTCDSSEVMRCSGKLYGAVWNDYAEFRICNEKFKPGQVVIENGDDTMSIANERLQRGCSIISDTFGFAIGETDEAKCPIAVSGRVLAYGYESREEFKKHIGYPVCSGPNGTVSIMTDEEEEKYASRIIGTISAVPDYETWGSGNIEVNNRIWIKIK